ncbi:acetolactate decarboxylase [Liquorilactobacillus satsumensis]|uniref:Alpha-acetolactate decarboxylase n=1 Tax=Liquorilactobacillus satsumensis DSM 16230 = JCM 12392 TaxID=1423801 RepID=A0A0R1V046_9LACO|nr:acetolactate decarboxylase [Liquorilactobacillus satsumensis]KRL98977.1 alpha-acetolactate decarboxylase [Liquorilactobacillus satsumensis DSM 16230 = JCM 12392]MCC7666952.1 acetolactate decarboxylase [Liquorilactobacillus satsumensis]MCP9312234.1 acetolactate decarboxylase [Liquorilactobacillus satsumensis]MCP9328738.1 acetolactate decarboxylase [Liquorilactobacillus satsumensis]MCP9357234.1 acetolactate decarboxylase [Liquorilactobacillus satsumensis]
MKKTNVLYQHGTLALLVPGLLAGTLKMEDLLKHGDTGIGTGEGLDGELIILDGIAYQVDSAGKVNLVSPEFTMPFANSHYADYQKVTTIANASPVDFEKAALQGRPNSNTFFSVLVKGTFSYMKTRAVVKSERPFSTLAETAQKQSIFEAKDVTGTFLSYYSPALFNGAAVAGYHNHFLASDHSIGGHVLDFKIAEGTLFVQTFDTLEQHLPVDNSEFSAHDFSKDDIAGIISQVE